MHLAKLRSWICIWTLNCCCARLLLAWVAPRSTDKMVFRCPGIQLRQILCRLLVWSQSPDRGLCFIRLNMWSLSVSLNWHVVSQGSGKYCPFQSHKCMSNTANCRHRETEKIVPVSQNFTWNTEDSKTIWNKSLCSLKALRTEKGKLKQTNKY